MIFAADAFVRSFISVRHQLLYVEFLTASFCLLAANLQRSHQIVLFEQNEGFHFPFVRSFYVVVLFAPEAFLVSVICVIDDEGSCYPTISWLRFESEPRARRRGLSEARI